MKLVNLTLKEKEEIDTGFTKMMVDDKVKEDIKFILANSDLSKVSTSFSDMLDWLEKKDRYMKCLQEANKKIGELIEQNYWKSEEDKKMIDNIISDLRELRNNETNEELISDYNREIDWLIKKMYEGKEN
jgi:predicted subunit of tRNA(5-methylaminomethyl-2-thiouridylate) methyltransferase